LMQQSEPATVAICDQLGQNLLSVSPPMSAAF